MVSCDGPLACHALKSCLERWTSFNPCCDHGDQESQELEQLLMVSLDGAMQCCGPGEGLRGVMLLFVRGIFLFDG